MVVVNIANDVCKEIQKIGIKYGAISYYSQFQVLTEVGREGIRLIAGVLISTGFIVAISTNFILLSCYDSLPLVIYICGLMISGVTYLVIIQTVPRIVRCNLFTKQLLKHIWPLAVTRRWSCVPLKTSRIILRTLKAQRPVTYYYGTAVFDQDTKINFYRNILEITTNCVLGFN